MSSAKSSLRLAPRAVQGLASFFVPRSLYAETITPPHFLVLTLPGGAKTHHVINREVLEALGPEGILVNIARGSVVDTDALIAVLREGKLRGAGLDVFEKEPHIPPALRDMQNVVLLPHIASNTAETRQAMADLTINNLVSYFNDGKLLTPVV